MPEFAAKKEVSIAGPDCRQSSWFDPPGVQQKGMIQCPEEAGLYQGQGQVPSYSRVTISTASSKAE